jgi:hypothetical protein
VASGTDRPEGRPLVLVAHAVVLGAAPAWSGTGPTPGVVAGALDVVLGVSSCRHLAFAVAAARWAERDRPAADVGLDGWTPTVAVLVGRRDEELVVDGMVAALPALDHPADRLILVVVDAESVLVFDADADADADADHEPEPCALRRLVRHLRDPAVGAVVGRCVIRNGQDSSMAGTVLVDYLPAAGRRGTGRSVLAIGAHPDDVELGCAGALLAHVAAVTR